jgi:long-chain acyl-CoA synthetase
VTVEEREVGDGENVTREVRFRTLEEAFEVGMNLAYWAERNPESPVIIFDGTVITYGQLNARCNQLARAFMLAGLQPDDAVALMAPNRPEWCEVYFATLRCGLRITPINYKLRPDESGYIVDNCEARAFVIMGNNFGPDAEVPDLPDRVVLKLSLDMDIPGYDDYNKTIASESPADLETPVLGSWMIYTSGTTGRPKGVYRKEKSAIGRNSAALGLGGRPRREPTSVHLSTGPLYHSAVNNMSIHSILTSGATVIIMDHFDPEEWLRLIEEYDVTDTLMVPTMFHRIMQLPQEAREKYDVSSLESVTHGAAPCPVSIKQSMIDWLGPIINEYYGSTETAGGAIIDSETWLKKPGSVGLPMDGSLVALDENMQPVPVGVPGVLYAKAPDAGRFEYFKDPEKTAKSYAGDLVTLGDVGYFDDDGFLYLTDRSADMIISGGVNIYPAEVDEVLLAHEAVGDVATIGVPDDEWGEIVLAAVELRPGFQASPELASEMIAYCRDRLAHFKCPRSVDFVEVLPRSDSGKMLKRVLRDQYREASKRG